MFGLTTLGIFHTAFSLVAVVAGLVCLLRDKEISPATRAGRLYIGMTVLSCVTGFGIFQHGGFGKPHMLGIITLLVLGVAWLARGDKPFGRAAPYIATLSYSFSFFLHTIPGATESLTRLPPGAPVLASADDPRLPQLFAAFSVLYLVGAVLQVRRLRAASRSAAAVGLKSPAPG